ncbi:MAG TPA: ABC transporter permease [Gammaproteobacteria bacterium]
MRLRDFIRLASGSVRAQHLRSLLTALGIAIGIASVVLLTAIGAGIHQFVLSEFTQFGTNLIAVTPGRVMTHGGSVGAFGTDRPLTIEDAQALARLPDVLAAEPIMAGNAVVESGGRERRTNVYGVGPHFPAVFATGVASGRFLPPDEPRAARAFAVLGSTLQRELFGTANPIGQRIRIGGETYRIIGVMQSKGQILGFDIDDTLYIPAAKALEMFGRDSLMEIDILYRAGADADRVAVRIKQRLINRHGKEDFTITTQQQMLEVLDKVLGVLTFAVAALGGISLVVGGVGILTIMTIAVRERTSEIGLLRALGAQRHHVQLLFLGEATLLAALGGGAGLLAGIGGAQLLQLALPALPVQIAWDYVILAEAVATLIGLAAGVLPARHAARLDPVEALRAE